MPRCGLAPGFICVVGGSLVGKLETVEQIQLRVGALPRSPNNALGYACTWSPDGIINEYLNDCEQLRGGELVTVPALENVETIVIDGSPYEAFTTSGGLGTMCETFAGRVDSLDYKTIRYPGHRALMRFMLHELGLAQQREDAVRLLADAYPPVRDDLVILYAAAEGHSGGRSAREEFVRVYRPRIVAGAPTDRHRMDHGRGRGRDDRAARRGLVAGLGLRLPGGRVAQRLPRHQGRPDAGARAARRTWSTTCLPPGRLSYGSSCLRAHARPHRSPLPAGERGLRLPQRDEGVLARHPRRPCP